MSNYERKHKYKAMHLPTGQVFERETDTVMNYFKLLETLVDWNRIGGAYWKYWV